MSTTTNLYTPTQALFRLDGAAFQRRDSLREFPLEGRVLSPNEVREMTAEGVQHSTELSTVSFSSSFMIASVLRTLELSDVTDHPIYGVSPQIGEYVKEILLTQHSEGGKEKVRYHLCAPHTLTPQEHQEISQELLEAIVHADSLAGILIVLPKNLDTPDPSLYGTISREIIRNSPPTRSEREDIVVQQIVKYARTNGFTVEELSLRTTV